MFLVGSNPNRDPPLDPARHLIGHVGMERDAQGRQHFRPVTLDEAVPWLRTVIAEGRAADDKRRPWRGAVLLTHQRAFAIRILINELATRMQPGLAVGPVQSDGLLSRFIQELVADLELRIWGS